MAFGLGEHLHRVTLGDDRRIGTCRTVLDAAAVRFGVEPPPYMAGDIGTVATLADAFAGSAAIQRALLFGAQQVLLQHRGLWDVLEARHQARLAG
jgi:hypothetical protein